MPLVRIDRRWVEIAQVDPFAMFLGNSRCQRDLDTQGFHLANRIPEALTTQVSGMGEDRSGVMTEPIPLTQEIVAAVITHFVDQMPVHVADFGDVRRKDHDSPPSATAGSSLYMPFAPVHRSEYIVGITARTRVKGCLNAITMASGRQLGGLRSNVSSRAAEDCPQLHRA